VASIIRMSHSRNVQLAGSLVIASVNTRRMSRRTAASGVPAAMRAAIGTGRGLAAAGGMQPAPVDATQPDGQAAAELAADRGHRRPGQRAGPLEAEVVNLEPGDLPGLPAANDRLGDLVGVDAELGPSVVGPGAQLPGQVGHYPARWGR
jgi:hypothetical protein